MLKDFFVDKLRVVVFETREEMGAYAASEVAEYFKTRLQDCDELNTIFAAAPSQNDVLSSLCQEKGIEWDRINAYHMDEYVGLDPRAPQRFGNYLDEHLFNKVPFKSVNYLDFSNPDFAARYDAMFLHGHADACVLGIGENGHIAFNDPGVADLFDTYYVKEVALDNICRMQQVHDGCFEKFEDVPEKAMTMTVPTLLRSDRLFCVVPCTTKAHAVKAMLEGQIGMSCPASALRLHEHATLYLDAAAAGEIL